MPKRALVTGAAGFIGSNLCRKLLEEGWAVTGVDDLSSGHLELVQNLKGLKMILNDFASDFVLEEVAKKSFDTVFHFAAIPRVSYSVENPSETTNNNVAKTVKLMEACRGKISRFIFSSSSSVIILSVCLSVCLFLSIHPSILGASSLNRSDRA